MPRPLGVDQKRVEIELVEPMDLCDLLRQTDVRQVHASVFLLLLRAAKNLGSHKAEQILADHPGSVYVREEALELRVSAFFRAGLFGENRKDRVRGQLKHLIARHHEERRKRIKSLMRAIGSVERKIET